MVFLVSVDFPGLSGSPVTGYSNLFWIIFSGICSLIPLMQSSRDLSECKEEKEIRAHALASRNSEPWGP